MPKLIKHRKYAVHWIDITQSVKWNSEEDVDKALQDFESGIESIGFFIKETDEAYVFTSGINSGKDVDPYFDLIVYPKGVVRKITRL